MRSYIHPTRTLFAYLALIWSVIALADGLLKWRGSTLIVSCM